MSTLDIKNPTIEFYALGKFPKGNIDIPTLKYNKSFKDTSNDILYRNKLSLNSENFQNLRNSSKKLFTLNNSNIPNNNYLDPFKVFRNNESYNIENNLVNKETYRLTKDNYYAK